MRRLTSWFRWLVLSVALSISSLTIAQVSLVKDINPSGSSVSAIVLSKMFKYDGVCYFVASDGIHGYELWRSDGTTAGTYLVKDLQPGTADGVRQDLFFSSTTHFYLSAPNTNILGRSDGTSVGTYYIEEYVAGGIDMERIDLNGTFYFLPGSSSIGTELWKTTGYINGAELVVDLVPGSFSPSIDDLCVLNGTLYFEAQAPSSSSRSGIWRSNGTTASTQVVYQGTEGEAFNPNFMQSIGGKLYMSAQDNLHGQELWTSDGSTSGTQFVADLNPTGGSNPRSFAGMNGIVYFNATVNTPGNIIGQELWRTDGTTNGTYLVKDIRPGSGSSTPNYKTVVNDLMFFTANDGVHGTELWRTDGTVNGTYMVKDISPGSAGGLGTDASLMTNVFGRLFFIATDNVHGTELWTSDGTEAGTYLVNDINPGVGKGVYGGLVPLGNDLLIFGRPSASIGIELMKVDLSQTCSSASTPTIVSSVTQACLGTSIQLSIGGGYLNGATEWHWYSTTCGGASLGSGSSIIVSPSITTTYYARGEGGCGETGFCGSFTVSPTQPSAWYGDSDEDGAGDPSEVIQSCDRPTGYVSNSTDQCPTDGERVVPGYCGCNSDLNHPAFQENIIPPSCTSTSDGAIQLSNLTGAAPFTFEWLDWNNDLALISTAQDLTGVPSGAYEVRVTDANTCTETSGMVPLDVSDTDQDATPDCLDGCPTDPLKQAPGTCGCGIPEGTCQGGTTVSVMGRVLLEGPYDSGTGLMNDALRSLGGFPLTDPYPGLGYTHTGGGNAGSVAPAVVGVAGTNAIVDWVLLELRSPTTGSILVSRSVLVQRDGDIVDLDGSSPVSFAMVAGNYNVAVRQRNHLGCMTASPVALSATVASVDFTSSALATYGTSARKGIGSVQVLWAGDATFNGTVKYTGSGNDRDPLLVTVGSTTPNNVVSNAYSTRDVNMNGQVKYTGSGNDRDPILVNVGSTTPNNVRVEQLP